VRAGSLTWNVGNCGNPPPSRALHGCVLRGNDMIVFGGLSEGRMLLNDVWSLACGAPSLPISVRVH
jgi:hypothetical protein